ncbi:MAG: (2Fe-2S) ferredoxin domain-containing protein [Candidatus Omnitrophica bacterium]|nr:(2Fe-2S) ferredoxin domain-containing protein [Candidatus Omnitrophota bacterium]
MAARRVFVDTSGATCPTKGGAQLFEALRASVARRGLQGVSVVARGCFGLCRLAPNLYVEPDGVWYSRVTIDDVEEIVEEHLIHGRTIPRLIRYQPPSTSTKETS